MQSSLALSRCAKSADSVPRLCYPNLSFRLLSTVYSFTLSKTVREWKQTCCDSFPAVQGLLPSGEQFIASKFERTSTLVKKTTYCPVRAIQILDILKIHFHESTYKFNWRGISWKGFKNYTTTKLITLQNSNRYFQLLIPYEFQGKSLLQKNVINLKSLLNTYNT